MNKKFAYGALTTAAFGLGAYAIYRFVRRERSFVSDDVRRKLPVAKDLPTIPDEAGNYDLDGVSFDIEGVIVSGDAVKSVQLY